jgi:hypothetical protein
LRAIAAVAPKIIALFLLVNAYPIGFSSSTHQQKRPARPQRGREQIDRAIVHQRPLGMAMGGRNVSSNPC